MEKPKYKRHKAAPGLWIELPADLRKKEINNRIKKYLERLRQPVHTYNPNA